MFYCALHQSAILSPIVKNKRKPKVTHQVVPTAVATPTIAVAPAARLIAYFHRAWPPAALVAALIINAAWVGLLAQGLFAIGQKVF
jgi:hypothetical protein